MLIGTVTALLAGGSSLAMAQQYGGPNGSQPLVMAPAGGPAYAPGYAGPYAYSYEQPGPFGWAPYSDAMAAAGHPEAPLASCTISTRPRTTEAATIAEGQLLLHGVMSAFDPKRSPRDARSPEHYRAGSRVSPNH